MMQLNNPSGGEGIATSALDTDGTLAAPSNAKVPSTQAVVDYAAARSGVVVLSVKNVTVLTSGAPADIATIAIPSWITRWRTAGSTTTNSWSFMIAETAAGPLNGASFTAWSAAGGTGTQLQVSGTGPASTSLANAVGWGSNTANINSSSTIYIRQTANSSSAGTISFYIVVVALN